jgi:hypothetical protein
MKKAMLFFVIFISTALLFSCSNSHQDDETTTSESTKRDASSFSESTKRKASLNENLSGKNEDIVISFLINESPKRYATLCSDKEGDYIVFRLGTSKSIRTEVLGESLSVAPKFEYEYYFRGGGKDNMGLDLNHLYFEDADNHYDLFDEFDAVSEKRTVGITIHNLAEKTDETFYAIDSTIIGRMSTLRFGDLHRFYYMRLS